jgi:hypothetical protein
VLWPFGIFCGRLVHFSRFGILHQGKSGNPDESVWNRRNADGPKFTEQQIWSAAKCNQEDTFRSWHYRLKSLINLSL